DAALGIEHVRRGVGDVGARAVDLGEVAHPVVGEGGAQIELARTRVSHHRLRYVLVGRVVGGGGDHRAGGGDLARLGRLQIERRVAAGGVGGVAVGGLRLHA